MNRLTLLVYVQKPYPEEPQEEHDKKLYSTGQTLINEFLKRTLLVPEGYSLLIYGPDRAKIEIKRMTLRSNLSKQY
jgi:hypothetical protein